jgi:hypothetical protein
MGSYCNCCIFVGRGYLGVCAGEEVFFSLAAFVFFVSGVCLDGDRPGVIPTAVEPLPGALCKGGRGCGEASFCLPQQVCRCAG